MLHILGMLRSFHKYCQLSKANIQIFSYQMYYQMLHNSRVVVNECAPHIKNHAARMT